MEESSLKLGVMSAPAERRREKNQRAAERGVLAVDRRAPDILESEAVFLTEKELYYAWRENFNFGLHGKRDLIDLGPALSQIVMRRVLPLLPAKSLIQLRCVSVDWNRWISSDFFSHMQSCFSHPVSGVFYNTAGGGAAAYNSFGGALHSLPDPALSFIPEPTAVISSARGLLCCRGQFSLGYYVCNPVTAEWAAMPPPAKDHGENPAVVLVPEELWLYNFDADYHLVCAFQIVDCDGGEGGGIYGFEVFSSRNWEWRTSDLISETERIVPGSGVAAGGAAHWRTTMQTVVSYTPSTDEYREIEWPAEHNVETMWELGEMGGRLCCTCLTGIKVVVQVLEVGDGESWKVVRRQSMRPYYGAAEPEEKDNLPWPLRLQGASELLFWDALGWKVVAWDMASRSERTLVDSVPELWNDFVPYISSLVHVKRNPFPASEDSAGQTH